MNFLKFKVSYLTICFLSTFSFGAIFPNGVTNSKFSGAADQVGKLPLIDFPLNFKHYSGYLDSIEGIKLHYWFFESQNRPDTDPVVIWLNGGPGCSSLYGAFTENGPIQANRNGSFSLNPYAWNLKANMLYLETPVLVGFSKNTSAIPYNNDARTAAQNVAALKSFHAKFPHLQKNLFYITGESYAGRYIPQLSVELLKQKFPLNFKGVAIGNGYLHNDDKNSNLYMVSHGLSELVKNNIVFGKEANYRHQLNKTKSDGFINPYNILADCNDLNDDGWPPCSGIKVLSTWLNRADVQTAIHIIRSTNDAPVQWNFISNVNYNSGSDSMANNVKTMVDAGLNVVIYNGDLDSMCDFIVDERFVDNLGYPVSDEYSSWVVENEIKGVIGGFSKTYHNGSLRFTTVRGAGHMVPFDKPQSALKILNEFLLQLPKN